MDEIFSELKPEFMYESSEKFGDMRFCMPKPNLQQIKTLAISLLFHGNDFLTVQLIPFLDTFVLQDVGAQPVNTKYQVITTSKNNESKLLSQLKHKMSSDSDSDSDSDSEY